MSFDEKYYRVYAEIDLDAVYENTINLKKNIKKETGLTAVIKTDGYGHGAVPIALKIEDVVESFAVATIDEAMNLVNHGVKKPIFIIGFTHESRIKEAIDNQIRITVYDYKLAKLISKQSTPEKKGLIHIKIDTGMSRIGLPDNQETVEIIKEISKLPNINIEGIFTHFACSDELDKTSTLNQLKRFIELTDEVQSEGVNIPLKHISNSAAIIDVEAANLSTVRAGISLYGIYPSQEVDRKKVNLTPVLSLKSHIIHLKEIEKGTGVSYGSTYIAKRKTLIATIPIGYGDGYPRSLSNKGYVLIKGKKASILGRVCMDQFMVDVTDIEGVENGDEVILVGKQGSMCISVEELSEISNRFPYEFICDIGKRIPRVYISGNRVVCTKDYFDDIYKMFD